MENIEISKKNNLTEEQNNFVFDKPNSTILISSAGSGKTFVITNKLDELIKNGVDPKKIIFFSFTTAAVEELKSRTSNKDIKITTIHAFCMSLLGKMGKMKKISSFYDFIAWFKKTHEPKKSASDKTKSEYYDIITTLYEEADYFASQISAYKLQTAENIATRLPDYYKEYCKFLKDTKSRDFSDMLIEVRNLLKDNKWLRMFKGQYEYIFIDEYQDSSIIQMEILLNLNAAYYYLVGDRAQSIYGYISSDCRLVESMLKRRRQTKEMSLSMNFRSATSIVENANLHTDLQAVPFHTKEGKVHKKIIFFDGLLELMPKYEEIVVLARTNSVIKEIERRFLLNKIPIRYFNYITQTDIINMKKGEINVNLSHRLEELKKVFHNNDALITFIESNKDKKSFVTSIHKSKGREFDTCVVVNSISKDILDYNCIKLPEESFKKVSFDSEDPEDFESKNVHYVAVTRPKNELYYMYMDV